MKLTHPDTKITVETDDPAEYVKQGWVDTENPEATAEDTADRASTKSGPAATTKKGNTNDA